MTSAPAIGFDCRPSCWVVRALDGVGLLAMLAVMLSGWPLWLGVGTAGVACGSVLAAQRRWKASPWVGAACDASGAWRLVTRTRDDQPASLIAFRVLGPCILLRFGLASGRQAVLLLAPDNSDADLRRRLRMRLAAAGPAAALPRI